ncbi:hypothetical protein QJS83_01245 [Bdellovibrio sp. 22V]|uniref:hypothetical protein n=1 Tax=Bdellovibrio TaxID=958 RepID=UPI0025433097|nr:hypothetical protein [Bdellovibrio sp. 22V]WII72493.1 hypothetical protein QJS83_01245 [Bdellovibrio sp. 22V]
MKKFVLSLISILSLAGAPAQAFISANEEDQLLQAMNSAYEPHIQFESVRCSLRGRMCLVRLEVGSARIGCMIERITAAEDLYHVSQNKMTGKTSVSLSPYAQTELNVCVNKAFAQN